MQNSFKIQLANEKQTIDFGKQLAVFLPEKFTFFLEGELGAGKTTFIRGILKGLGIKEHIKSPTYTLVETYEIKHKIIFHFDLYRLKDPQELESIGIRDYYSRPAILLFEWPEKGINLLPNPDLTCSIEPLDVGRVFKLTAHSQLGSRVIQQLK